MKLALYQPDIPQNAGSAIRLAACMGVELHIIEPCGFPWDERRLRAVALDYLDHARIIRHTSFEAFERWRKENGARLILLSTKANLTHINFTFRPDDILLLGRESSGVPQDVVDASDTSLRIPMNPAARSLNVVLAGAVVLSEALRQTHQFPQ